MAVTIQKNSDGTVINITSNDLTISIGLTPENMVKFKQAMKNMVIVNNKPQFIYSDIWFSMTSDEYNTIYRDLDL